MKLKRLGHVLFRVADVERSKDFYTRILGFQILEEDPDHDGVVFMALADNSHTIDLAPVPAGTPSTPQIDRRAYQGVGFRHVAFSVATQEELRDSYFELQDKGVEVFSALDHVNQQSIYFRDPDDNVLEIYWERPNSKEIFERGRGDNDEEITFARP